MIVITKEEKERLLEKFPNAFVAVTGRCKKSKRKRYYACEYSNVVSYIRALRRKKGEI